MLFSIIIPTYNNLAELKLCLDGLAKQTIADFKVIICIDGSIDGTSDYLRSAKYNYHFVIVEHSDKKNHGRNPTRNLAIPHISSDYLLLLDSDAVPASDLLEKHQACLLAHDGVSVGMMEYTNTAENLWARYLMTRGRSRLPAGTEIPFHLFNSGNAAFRARYFLESGGQDASMIHFGAGYTEFAIRLNDRYHLRFFNSCTAIAYSTMQKNIDFALAQMEELGAHNLKYLYTKYPAHRNLYTMDTMRRFSFFFHIASTPVVQLVLKKVIGVLPNFLQIPCVRYLVITSVFTGFTSR